jgi:cytochrome oxidase Cu insertion factor (SCO1/SenC/PrrC family)
MTMARALLLMSLVTIVCICATNAAMDASPGPGAMAMSPQVSGSPSQEPQEPPCCEDDKKPTPKTDDEECCEQKAIQEPKKDENCCEKPTEEEASRATAFIEAPKIADLSVLDQDGQRVQFHTDLIAGKTVLINVFFSTCTTVCPPLTATMRRVQQLTKEQHGDAIRIISISVDPANDTPARIKKFGALFGAEPGWSFITGDKPTMDQLLRSLDAATGDITQHTATVLIGNDQTGEWARTYGLSSAEGIAEIASGIEERAAVFRRLAEASEYFPNNVLVDHDGNSLRFFDDLLRDRLVLMHVLFTRCTGVCPPIIQNLKNTCAILEDRLGPEVVILSITVDPEFDNVERMKAYHDDAELPDDGWLLLGGEEADVKQVLTKIGAWTSFKEDHNGWLILGNTRTGDWRKLQAMASPLQIADMAREMLGESVPVPTPETATREK